MKKPIERSLPFSGSYMVTSIITNGIESDWCTCDNCGKQIANKAFLTDAKEGSKYIIGLDCLKTLTAAKSIVKSDYFQSADDLVDAARVASFVGFATGATFKQDWMYITATKDGKTKKEFSHLLEKYAPVFLSEVRLFT